MKKLVEAASVEYKLGDRLVAGGENHERYNRCNRCKRHDTLRITKVPASQEPKPARGFWKIPEE